MDLVRIIRLCVVPLAFVMLSACSGENSTGGVEGGDSPENHHGSSAPVVVDTVRAPLYVYEILKEYSSVDGAGDTLDSVRVALEPSGADIVTLLSRPRVEQLLMNKKLLLI